VSCSSNSLSELTVGVRSYKAVETAVPQFSRE
jgi:hypothetical protein